MNAIPTRYTPALGWKLLTPLYDVVIRQMTRERVWRDTMVREIAPVSADRILDIGCGTGSLLIDLWGTEKGASYVGIDPDADVLDRAGDKAAAVGARLDLRRGFASHEMLPDDWRPTKIVSSLVLHQVPLAEKRRIMEVVHELLVPGGTFYLTDYGKQDEAAMRFLFRNTVQRVDGITDTQPNADGVLPQLLAGAGFEGIVQYARVRTMTGAVSLYSAKRGIHPQSEG